MSNRRSRQGGRHHGALIPSMVMSRHPSLTRRAHRAAGRRRRGWGRHPAGGRLGGAPAPEAFDRRGQSFPQDPARYSPAHGSLGRFRSSLPAADGLGSEAPRATRPAIGLRNPLPAIVDLREQGLREVSAHQTPRALRLLNVLAQEARNRGWTVTARGAPEGTTTTVRRAGATCPSPPSNR